MPKKAHLANHFYPNELKQNYLKSQAPVEARRWYVLGKVALGWTIKNAAIGVGLEPAERLWC